MAGKKSGAASAKDKSEKITYAPRSLNAALNDLFNGSAPRGAKFVIGDKETRLITTTRGGDKVHFIFVGSPAEFAQAVLKHGGVRSVDETKTSVSSTAASTDDE